MNTTILTAMSLTEIASNVRKNLSEMSATIVGKAGFGLIAWCALVAIVVPLAA